MKDYKLGLVFSIFVLSTVLILSTSEEGFALKSKGTSLPETGSKKVCGDKLCSEVSSKDSDKRNSNSTQDDDTTNKKYKIDEHLEIQHLETFDELDFDVFTNQKWDRLKESHSEDILVH